MYSYGPPHMTEQKQDDQLEHTYSSYVRIRDVALKNCQKRWMIWRSGDRGSAISVLTARHDDDNNQISFERLIWRRFSSLVLKSKFSRTTVDYTVTRHQETEQNMTKSWAGRPKATPRTNDNFIRVTSFRDRRLTAPNITAQLTHCHEKNVSTCTARKRLCEAGLYGRISVKIPLLRKQNNVKRLQSAKVQKDWTIEQWNKVHWAEESKFKIFGLNSRVYVWQRVGERAATPLYHTSRNAWRRLS